MLYRPDSSGQTGGEGEAISTNFHCQLNNLRLFEATGAGTCLVTDWKANIREFFEPEREVVTYRSADELCERLQYLLEHDAERKQIAESGQRRTLKDHTYENRIPELIKLLKRNM